MHLSRTRIKKAGDPAGNIVTSGAIVSISGAS